MFNNKYGAEIQDYRVLIVEKEDRVRELFGTVLSVLGVKYGYFANDALVALRRIQKGLLKQRKCPFDLLIVNNEMPDMSGMELIGRLRQERELRGMSVIVTTRECPEEILQECNRLEVCALLRQPFDLENLCLIIYEAYLSSSQARV
jgi:CheY-like chemotaxis protein